MTPQTIYALPPQGEIVAFRRKEVLLPVEQEHITHHEVEQPQIEHTDDIQLRMQQIQAIIQDHFRLEEAREALQFLA